MMGLPNGQKKFKDRFNRLDTIPACDSQPPTQPATLPYQVPRYATYRAGKNAQRYASSAIKCVILRYCAKMRGTRTKINPSPKPETFRLFLPRDGMRKRGTTTNCQQVSVSGCHTHVLYRNG